jgi:hypothetical protein
VLSVSPFLPAPALVAKDVAGSGSIFASLLFRCSRIVHKASTIRRCSACDNQTVTNQAILVMKMHFLLFQNRKLFFWGV